MVLSELYEMSDIMGQDFCTALPSVRVHVCVCVCVPSQSHREAVT